MQHRLRATTFKDGLLQGIEIITVATYRTHSRLRLFQVSVRYTRITLPSRHSRKVDGSVRRSWRSSRGNSAPIQRRNTRDVFALALSRSTIRRWTSITDCGTTTSWLTSSTGTSRSAAIDPPCLFHRANSAENVAAIVGKSGADSRPKFD